MCQLIANVWWINKGKQFAGINCDYYSYANNDTHTLDYCGTELWKWLDCVCSMLLLISYNGCSETLPNAARMHLRYILNVALAKYENKLSAAKAATESVRRVWASRAVSSWKVCALNGIRVNEIPHGIWARMGVWIRDGIPPCAGLIHPKYFPWVENVSVAFCVNVASPTPGRVSTGTIELVCPNICSSRESLMGRQCWHTGSRKASVQCSLFGAFMHLRSTWVWRLANFSIFMCLPAVSFNERILFFFLPAR